MPRPLHGFLEWLGRRLHFVDRFYDWSAPKPRRREASSGRSSRVLVVALAAWAAVAARAAPRPPRGAGRADSAQSRGRLDPGELERLADEAERRGDLEIALRLRFRAGLLRLGRAQALELRPSLTTREARRALRNPPVRPARAELRRSRLRTARRRRASDLAAARDGVAARARRRSRRDPRLAHRRRDRRRARRSSSSHSTFSARSPAARRAAPSPRRTRRGPTGRRRYAELLGRHGHPVDRAARRRRTSEPRPDARRVVLLDPPSVPSARRGSAACVRRVAGGRLVAGGPRHRLVGASCSRARRAAGVAASPRSARRGVRAVRRARVRRRARPDEGGSRAVAARTRRPDRSPPRARRERQVTAPRRPLAAPEPPARLVRDNAALGLALAGAGRGRSTSSRPITATAAAVGSRALPLEWKLLLGGLAAATLVCMVARGRRFGPPEHEAARAAAAATANTSMHSAACSRVRIGATRRSRPCAAGRARRSCGARRFRRTPTTRRARRRTAARDPRRRGRRSSGPPRTDARRARGRAGARPDRAGSAAREWRIP